jgi:hypothetical protein
MVLIIKTLLTTGSEKKTMALSSLIRRSTMPKKLAKQIETRLDKLAELLDNITAAQAIDPNDSDT